MNVYTHTHTCLYMQIYKIYVNLVEYMKYKNTYFYTYILYNTYILYTHVYIL